jgi:hypothetical protein
VNVNEVPPARASKAATLSFAERLTPQYAEMVRELQRGGGWFRLQPRVAAYLDRIGSYVKLYEDEKKLGIALMCGLVGIEEFKQFNEEVKQWTPERQQQYMEEFATDTDFEHLLDEIEVPDSDEGWDRATEIFNALPKDQQEQTATRTALLYGGAFGGFFNTLSLMVHRAKLTTLVPLAISGNQDAYVKAVQIDRLLLLHHPYFRERKQQAQSNGEGEFLAKLAYTEANPPVRGRLQYPGLYVLFGILDSLGWLQDLRHDEILDACDRAGLDRYQNRIEDVNYVTKRLSEYRRWQKTGGVSMH